MNDVPILQQNQDESSLTGKAKEIDEKTYIVRKLVDAIERNTGNDGSATWVSSGKWYNEAMDGITIEVQTTQITVGFNSPALRSSVLDVKLIPLFEEGNKSNTKATFFKKYFSSAFRTQNYSTAMGSVEDVIGKFKGTSIKLIDTENLFTSKVFYIPNVTTQDLH